MKDPFESLNIKRLEDENADLRAKLAKAEARTIHDHICIHHTDREREIALTPHIPCVVCESDKLAASKFREAELLEVLNDILNAEGNNSVEILLRVKRMARTALASTPSTTDNLDALRRLYHYTDSMTATEESLEVREAVRTAFPHLLNDGGAK